MVLGSSTVRLGDIPAWLHREGTVTAFTLSALNTGPHPEIEVDPAA
jgi:hypothetical protein